MKNKLDILKEIDRNLTYESIRFNNKQISDQLIKSTIQQYFPKLISQQQSKDLQFFTMALKDEEIYKKIRLMVTMHLALLPHLQELETRRLEKQKISDSSHCVEEMNNKKMTRAAVARRNQMTQQQLRKDQIYVRLTPKTQTCLQWMLCNRKFPRIQCKLSCNQHIEYLINYLSNKWLPGKGHNRIVLYPDVGSYLKNSLPAKEREKILRQPLNNYFMFTDVMVGCGIGQNGILNLHYDIVEKNKDTNRVDANLPATISQKGHTYKKPEQPVEKQKKTINSDEAQQSNKKSSSSNEKQQKGIPLPTVNVQSNQSQSEHKKISHPQLKSEPLHHPIHTHSNHFLSNESNLLNPNRSIDHDEESIFKSIGFSAFGAANANSIGFKRNDYNLLSINSNSLLDLESINPIKHQNIANLHSNTKKEQQQCHKQQKSSIEPKEVKAENSQNSQDLQTSKQRKSELSPLKSQYLLDQNKDSANEIKIKKQSGQDEVKQKSTQDLKKHNQILLDLREAINFFQKAEGLKGDPAPQKEQISQKSLLKQIKTVSIKKKTTN